MKKALSLFLLIFLLTGCSVQYNLDLTNDQVQEKMQIIEDDNTSEYFETLKNFNGNVSASYMEEEPDTTEKLPGYEYYDIENNSDEEKVNLSLEHIFATEEFKNSNIINTCYDNVNFINNDKNIDISTSSRFLCFKKYVATKKIEVNITTNKKITEHNADTVSGNTYTWVIDRTNAYNKPIRLSSVTENKVEKEENTKFNLIVILSAIGGFLILIFALISYKKHKYNSN